MSYRLKEIIFFNRKVAILCQNENGPCPLIAISNVLLLQGQITIHPDYTTISLTDLIQLVANRLLEVSSNPNIDDIQHQQQVISVIDILPKLQYGLDVNVRFDSVTGFEFTEELSVFDAFDIPLFHGWVVDPENLESARILSNLSYNHVILKVVEYKALVDSSTRKADEQKEQDDVSTFEEQEAQPSPNNPDLDLSQQLREGAILETFLADTASQLTFAGLMGLLQTLRPNQLAVFFRNNHFGTVFRKDDKLFLLVTDFGYADEPSVVWEGLDTID
eukprot:gene7941-16268_t